MIIPTNCVRNTALSQPLQKYLDWVKLRGYV